MSRHRSVRRLDADDFYDDEDDYDDAYDEEGDYGNDEYDEDYDEQVPYDPSTHKAASGADLRREIAQVREILGDAAPSTDQAIRRILQASGNDVQRAIDSILNGKDHASSTSATTTQSTFAFDQPSPDDIVRMARTKSANTPQTPKNTKSHTKNNAGSVRSSVGATASSLERMSLNKSQGESGAHSGSQQNLQLPTSVISSSENLSRSSPAISRSQSLEGTTGSVDLARNTSTTSTASFKSNPKWKRVDIKEEYAKRASSDKERLNLVVTGHVDAGKSTMMGHLLVLLGEVSDRTIKKYERDAERMKKGSFAYAWVLDETDDERSRGVTIDVAVSKFETPKHKFTLLDAPGHKDFVPNMISGASQADVSILVVDSNQGEFESGFDHGGQTREHAMLLRSLGVAQLIVAVNKMDMMNWSQERFDDIYGKLMPFLTQTGFKKESITFVPCSGFTGENLLERHAEDLNAWYSGPTLVEALDALKAPRRPIDQPFRMSIQDMFKGGMSGGGDVTVSGRIESGGVQLGDAVLAMPVNQAGHVRAIEVMDETAMWAAAGDRVNISLAGLDMQQLNTGDVLCVPSNPVPVTTHLRAQIVTLDIAIPLTIGVPVVLHHLGRSEAGYLSRLESQLDKGTGAVTKRNPRALSKNVMAIVEIRTQRPICIERFSDVKDLGRIMLRSGSTTVAAGIVMDIYRS